MRGVLLIAFVACAPTPPPAPIRGGFPPHQQAIEEAVKVTSTIWRLDAFWDLVERQPVWIAAPGQEPVSGADVRRDLAAHHPEREHYRVVLFFGRIPDEVFYSPANAVSSTCHDVEILQRRVLSDTLVDTIAHENTHVANVDGKCTPRYLDGDYSQAELPWLVSYGIGDLVQCFASSGADADRTDECFRQTVNATARCRTYEQCCSGGAISQNVQHARELAPQCRSSCGELEALCQWQGR